MIDFEKLREPFKPEEIEWRVGSTNKEKTMGMALAYVTNRAIQQRLDDVVGPLNWKNEYKMWESKSQLCGISIYCEERKEWITKWDGAEQTDFEAIKGGLSDAMKRAAYQWGIGRYLYNLPAQWCPIEPAGKSYRLTVTPSLPEWALPSGYVANNAPQQNNPPQGNNVQQNTRPESNNQPQNAGKGFRGLSAKQISRAEIKARVANMSMGDVKLWMQKKYGKDSIASLNYEEYTELCNALDEHAKKIKQSAIHDIPDEEGWRNEYMNG